MPENFYDLLGVDEDATSEELKRAYRKRAREYHPDVNADDRAGTQFKTVRRAYDVLRDETERSAYDRLGHETYVRKRMKGLPSSPSSDSADSSRSGSSDSASSSSSSSAASESSSSTTSSSASSSGSAGSRSSGSSATSTSSRSTSGRSSSSTTGSATASTATSGSRESTRRTSSTAGSSGTTNGSGTAGSSGTTGRQYRPQESSAPSEPSGRRTRLRNRWVAVCLAFGVYVAGLAQFALANEAALSSLGGRLAADPVSALVTGWGLGAPTAFVRGLAVDPSAALLFPLGAVLLPVALATTVFGFGRGAAWLYLVGALAPLAGFVAGPVLPAAAGVDLALFVALPVVAALVFLGDVGRYLVATR